MIDPGPDLDDHVTQLLTAVEAAARVTILLTHGHGDHADAVEKMVEGLQSRGTAFSVRGAGHSMAEALAEGEAVLTDSGRLEPVPTPGHSREHLAFLWPDGDSLFVGDLLLGKGETTWVGEYSGCVADYLSSLNRIRDLHARVLYPTHGPPLTDAEDAIGRFRQHREERIEQVRRALESLDDATPEQLMAEVYGDTVAPKLRGATMRSLEALMEFALEQPGK